MVSEDTARAVDREVKQLMTEAHTRAVAILRQHRTALDAVVRLLLAHEVVEGEEVRHLVEAEPAVAPALRALA
jgi:cell division protease FtsH